ncbi:MAG: magnesium transporter [Oscillospiraceae bacterium]|nr:magnesium transporter [Oscillospiraceae bacterium]
MAERSITLEATISALAEQKKYPALRDILVTMNPADVAALFDELEEHTLPLLFRLLPKDQAAETFVEMDTDTQELLIRGFSDSELKEVVDELYVDDAVDLVEEMPANVVKRILRQADAETRKLINEILKYPDDSAGSIMTTEFVDLRPTMTAVDAIKHIKRTGVDSETINTCYITDNGKRLIGAVSIRAIILAEDEEPMADVMEDNVISIGTLADQEEAVSMFTKYNFTALPVVDGEGRLVGIITVDDAMDVMETEATEDIEIMGGVTPIDKPYLKTSAFQFWKSRIPWLMLLMISATFTGMILNHFEDALAAVTALTLFIPMLMDTGGNSGSQCSVTVIRALSLGDLSFSDLVAVIWKEIRVGVLCGLSLAVVAFGKIMLIDHLLLHNDGVTVLVALTVCLTLALVVLVAKIVGCILPMLADKLGFDPAVMSSPFITTIVDALSLLIYFCIAQQLLQL